MSRTLPPWLKRSKFRAKRFTCPKTGDVFDSTGEYKRWVQLKERWEAGEISGLRRQVELKLVVNGMLIATYRADFAYEEDGDRVVEDFKGFPTPEYRLKKKLVKACHGITITETRERLDVGKSLKRMLDELDEIEDD